MSKWLLGHPMRLIGWVFAVVAVAHLFKHEWLQALVMLPLAGMLLVYTHSLDAAFRSGWHGGAAAMDDWLAGVVDRDDRIVARELATRRIPSQAEYGARLQAMVKELAMMENPSPEELTEVYRRYRSGQ